MLAAVTDSGGTLTLAVGAILLLIAAITSWRLLSHHRHHNRTQRERGRQRREFWGWE